MVNEDKNTDIAILKEVMKEVINETKDIKTNLVEVNSRLEKIENDSAEKNNKIKNIENYITDQITQSMGKKPEIRWWHRLGDEISETMNKIFEKITATQIWLSVFSIFAIIFLGNYLDYFYVKHPKAIIYFYIFILFVIFIIPLYVIIKDGYKIFRETSTIAKIKTLMNDFKPFTGFLSVIFFLNITLFATIEITLIPIIFVCKHPTIIKIFHSFYSNYERISVSLIFLVAFLFFMGFFKILTALIKSTLQSFNDKWKYYEISIFTIALVSYTIISTLIYIYLQDIIYKEAAKEQFYTKEYYDAIGNKYIYVFLVIYALSIFEFIIANYKIDKKLMAIWEKKKEQLEQFTDSTNDH